MNSRQFRMIALDLDGTVLAPDGKVSPRTRRAIHLTLGRGIHVCFATGRNFTESRSVLREIDHHAPGVFAGGAMVIDAENGATLHRTLLTADLAIELCDALESAGHAVLALQDTQAAGCDYLVTGDFPLNQATDHWMHVTRASVKRLPRLAEHGHQHTVRIGIVAPRDEVSAVQRQIKQQFNGRIMSLLLRVPAAGVDVLEIFHPSVNKWAGVMEIAGRSGIAAEQVIAVGDDLNDISMLRQAGLGLAMGNANEEAKKSADRTIGSNAEDGLAEFLEEFVASHAAHNAA